VQSTFGDNLEVVARIGDRLAHFWRDSTSQKWNGPLFFTGGVAATPSFIQGRLGNRVDFEVVAPVATGGLVHLTRNNETFAWSAPVRFGSGAIRSAALIQSNTGQLEVVARVGSTLVHYWRPPVAPWTWYGPLVIGRSI
jgi:hypothetical protein